MRTTKTAKMVYIHQQGGSFCIYTTTKNRFIPITDTVSIVAIAFIILKGKDKECFNVSTVTRHTKWPTLQKTLSQSVDDILKYRYGENRSCLLG